MMRPFEYLSPANTRQAASLLAATWGQTEILAGGTDLLALMKEDVVTPKRLINIKEITELRGVTSNAQGLRIGALTTLGELAGNASVRENYPALAEAVHEAASPQIRNMATLGGNLCQRPRCWYFRNGLGLLPKDETGKDLVTDGDNRYHAILGNSGAAKFVSPSTIAPVLIAYGAKVHLEGPKGKRELALDKFFVAPKAEGEREHDLRPNEMVTEIIVPPAGGWKVAHYEVRQKAAFDWPLAVAAVALKTDGSTVQASRVVLGHVAPTPWPSPEAEAALKGQKPTEDSAEKAGAAAVRNAKPLSQNAYKVRLTQVAVKRAILKAAGGAA
jgi:xanthine dehydrogenase YagS FAD-binding subunit